LRWLRYSWFCRLRAYTGWVTVLHGYPARLRVYTLRFTRTVYLVTLRLRILVGYAHTTYALRLVTFTVYGWLHTVDYVHGFWLHIHTGYRLFAGYGYVRAAFSRWLCLCAHIALPVTVVTTHTRLVCVWLPFTRSRLRVTVWILRTDCAPFVAHGLFTRADFPFGCCVAGYIYVLLRFIHPGCAVLYSLHYIDYSQLILFIYLLICTFIYIYYSFIYLFGYV